MKRRRVFGFAFLLLLLMGSLPAFAQDATEEAVQADGEAQDAALVIAGESMLDPTFLSLKAGGNVQVSTVAPDCTGYISAQPNVTLDYTPGDAEKLSLFFYSDNDPVMVVQTPDGSFICNDDTNGRVLDPTVTVENPAAGRYAIWLGDFAQGQKGAGFLVLTQGDTFNASNLDLADFVQREPLTAEQMEQFDLSVLKLIDPPVGGTGDFAAANGPLTADVTAGGNIAAFNIMSLGAGCTGFISAAPTYVVNVGDGESELDIFARSDTDTTLLVVAPDGSFVCNDDTSGDQNLNPSLKIAVPEPGKYLIYVGTFSEDVQSPATLTVTASDSEMPAPLMAATESVTP